MFPENRFMELLIIGALALIVVGPKDLPILMRRVGQFVGKMRGMAAEFRASFDELARQSELEELRKEVEAMRTGQHSVLGQINPLADESGVLGDIHTQMTSLTTTTPAPLPSVEAIPPIEPAPAPDVAAAKPPRAKPAAKAASAGSRAAPAAKAAAVKATAKPAAAKPAAPKPPSAKLSAAKPAAGKPATAKAAPRKPAPPKPAPPKPAPPKPAPKTTAKAASDAS